MGTVWGGFGGEKAETAVATLPVSRNGCSDDGGVHGGRSGGGVRDGDSSG